MYQCYGVIASKQVQDITGTGYVIHELSSRRVQRVDRLGSTVEETTDTAVLKEPLINASGTGKGSTHGRNILHVHLQVINGDAVCHRREIIKGGLPVHAAEVRHIEDLLHILIDCEERDASEGELVIGDNTLKLHTEAFGVFTGLDQERHPVRRTVWVLNHQLGHIPRLRDDILADYAVDTLVIGILLCAAEPAFITKMLIIHVLGEEDACRSDFCILIMLQHLPDTLITHQLYGTFGIVGSEHSSGCLVVDVDAIVGSHHTVTEEHTS